MSGNAVLDAEASERREVSEPLRGDTRPERRTVNGTYQQAAVSAIVCGPSLMFGQWLGWSSAVQPLLQSSASPVGQLTEDQISWLATLLLIGGVPSPFLWSWLADRLGRKRTLLLSVIPSLIGCFLVSFHSAYYSLLVSCFLGGVTGAAGFVLSPVYIVEVAHVKLRGALGSFVIGSMNVGILVSYTLGGVLNYNLFNYANVCLTVVQMLLILWVPETPYHQWKKGEKNKAEDTLLWLRGGDLRSMEAEVGELTEQKKDETDDLDITALFDTKGKRRGMSLALGVMFFQQFSGILVVLAYTHYIFLKAGSSLPPERSSIIVGVFQLFASFASTFIVEKAGRRCLLLMSNLSMALALMVVGLYFYLDFRGFSVNSFSWIPVVALSVHVLTYALGAGPVPLIIMTEVLPPEIRGLASSTIIFAATIMAFTTVAIVPYLLKYAYLHGCLWFFSVFCFLGFFFVLKFMPETKGVPIKTILQRLNGEKRDNQPN